MPESGKINDRKSRWFSDVNYFYSGYIFSSVPITGSFFSILYFGAGIWATLSVAARRYPLRIPKRALPFLLSGLALFLLLIVSGLAAQNPTELPKFGATTIGFVFSPFLIARYRNFEPERSWRAVIRYSPLGAIIGFAAAMITGSQEVAAGNAGVFALVMGVLAIFSLAGVLSGEGFGRIAGSVGFLAAASTIYLTDTRTLFPIAFALPLLALMFGEKRSPKFAIAVAVAVLAIAAVNAGHIVAQWQVLQNELWLLGENRPQSSLGVRLELWAAAIRAIGEHPLFGYGLQNKMAAVLSQTDDRIAWVDFTHVHNAFLDVAVAGGIPSLIAFMAVLFTPLAMVFGHKDEVPGRRFAAISLVILFLLQGLTSVILTHDLVFSLFMLPLTIIAAADPNPAELKIGSGVRSSPPYAKSSRPRS
jgi:O-antigen ligase